jgi:glyoxylase I family protein
MELRGVHHVSINVTDLDQSLVFYRDTLGLKVIESRPDDVITVEGAWLGCPDGREIHLLVNEMPTGKGQHYAFEVGDIESTVATLSGAGLKVSKPAEMVGICRQVFCKDPSGNLVEFNQRL